MAGGQALDGRDLAFEMADRTEAPFVRERQQPVKGRADADGVQPRLGKAQRRGRRRQMPCADGQPRALKRVGRRRKQRKLPAYAGGAGGVRVLQMGVDALDPQPRAAFQVTQQRVGPVGSQP